MNLEKHLTELEQDGYTVIPDALSQREVSVTLQAVKDLLEEEREVALTTGTQSDNLLTSHTIVGKHPIFYEFFLNPPTMQIVRKMIDDDALLYDANIRIPMPTGAANPRQGFQLHVDREDYSVVPFVGGKHFPMAMNVTWCLVDFTINNGATLLWPGSHNSCIVPEPESRPPGYIYAEAPAGSAVIWDAAIWHASGINCSDEPRYAVLAYYIRYWMRGRTDSLRFIPPDVQPKLSEEAKHLLGFRPAPPDYSDVKALSPERLASLSVQEKKVLGFAVY